jgi:hypothetical protein
MDVLLNSQSDLPCFTPIGIAFRWGASDLRKDADDASAPGSVWRSC